MKWDNDLRIDRRRRTAHALTNLLMRAVEPHLNEDHHARDDAARAIFDALMQQGITVLTEQDRQELGLAPQDEKGWTYEEIRAYEARLLMALTSLLRIEVAPTFTAARNDKGATA